MVYLMTTTVIYLGLIQTVFEPIIGLLFRPYNEYLCCKLNCSTSVYVLCIILVVSGTQEDLLTTEVIAKKMHT